MINNYIYLNHALCKYYEYTDSEGNKSFEYSSYSNYTESVLSWLENEMFLDRFCRNCPIYDECCPFDDPDKVLDNRCYRHDDVTKLIAYSVAYDERIKSICDDPTYRDKDF